GTASASIAGSARIGSAANPVGALSVTASTTDTLSAEETISSGGLVNLDRHAAEVADQPQIIAKIDGALVHVAGDAEIHATSSIDGDTKARGQDFSVVGVGTNAATTEVTPTLVAAIEGATRMEVGGALTVSATNSLSVATARAEVPAGGVVLAKGAEANAAGAAHVEARIVGSEVHAGGALMVDASSTNEAVANNDQITVGLLAGVGDATAQVYAGTR